MTAITLDAIQAGSQRRPLLAHYPDGIG